VIVEAALRSGSLITARLAQEAGREVFAVPGSPLDPRARGGNDLIRQGAILVETAADILANLPSQPSIPSPQAQFHGLHAAEAPWLAARPGVESAGEAPQEARAEVLSLLSADSTPVDELVRRCHFPSSITMAVLLELELAGRVETRAGNRIALLPDIPY
jgi:DNA processing protein